MEMEQSVPKRRHMQFRRGGITQKKAYNIQNTAKVWNQEYVTDVLETWYAQLISEQYPRAILFSYQYSRR